MSVDDFTKEELEEIIESFDWIESETSWEWMPHLRIKIQKIIEDHCESKRREQLWNIEEKMLMLP